jgi:hypothetical protein
LFECCVQVFICPNMVVMAVDNTLSSEGRLICVEHDAGEPRLCSTVLEKLPIKLLSPGVVRWAHCLNFLPMIRVKLLLMHDLCEMHAWRVQLGVCWKTVCQQPYTIPLPLTWECGQSSPVHSHACWQSTNQSLSATDLWTQTCCGAEVAEKEKTLLIQPLSYAVISVCTERKENICHFVRSIRSHCSAEVTFHQSNQTHNRCGGACQANKQCIEESRSAV